MKGLTEESRERRRLARVELDGHYVIEGLKLRGIKHAFSVAKGLGYTGSKEGLRRRLKRGITTWTEVLKPKVHEGGSAIILQHKAKAREEMAALLADYDARKTVARAGDEEE